MSTQSKTNVMRLLEQAGIAYRSEHYEDVHDEDWSSLRTSEALGVPAGQIFKTLVLRGDGGRVLVCCLPSDGELDLKKTARSFGDKKVEMIHVREIREITGYVRGGCSPIGMKKAYPVRIDETAQLYDEIYVNAGALDTLVILAPDRLVEFTTGQYADLTKTIEQHV